jgi:hypothetical protein
MTIRMPVSMIKPTKAVISAEIHTMGTPGDEP